MIIEVKTRFEGKHGPLVKQQSQCPLTIEVKMRISRHIFIVVFM